MGTVLPSQSRAKDKERTVKYSGTGLAEKLHRLTARGVEMWVPRAHLPLGNLKPKFRKML